LHPHRWSNRGSGQWSETTARNAVRQARTLGLLHVEERRVSAWRNMPQHAEPDHGEVEGLDRMAETAGPEGWVHFSKGHDYPRE